MINTFSLARRSRKSMTLMEALIDAAILSLLSLVIITSLLGSLRTNTQSAIISGAGQLANEKMEILRNLPYDSLSTQHGSIIPQGTILDDEVLTSGSKRYSVHTDIEYIDDPYDGLAGGNPNDTNPADYKKITIRVSDTITTKELVSLSTNIASRAAETPSNTGVLKIIVLSATGNPVLNADVTITNANLTPPLSIVTQSDADGSITIPNLTPRGGYHIQATKAGFSTDYTSAAVAPNLYPTNPDASVLLQQVTTVTLNIDTPGSITLTASGLNGTTPTTTLTGQKLIGTNPNLSKTTRSVVTSASTEVSNVEYDSYSFVPPAGWYITTCNPMQPFRLDPGSHATVDCIFTQDAAAMRISTISPRIVAPSPGVSWSITGTNLAGTTVALQSGCCFEIAVNGMALNEAGTALEGMVNFSAVPVGIYNVVVRNGGGGSVTQINGLTVQ